MGKKVNKKKQQRLKNSLKRKKLHNSSIKVKESVLKVLNKKGKLLEGVKKTKHQISKDEKIRTQGIALATMEDLSKVIDTQTTIKVKGNNQPSRRHKKSRAAIGRSALNFYKQVLNDPNYQSNPADAIQQHVKNTFKPSN